MKIAFVSSSLSNDSVSRRVLKNLYLKFSEAVFIDLRDIDVRPYWRHNKDQKAYQLLSESDGIIIGGGVYNYSINDSLKIFIDNYFDQNLKHMPVGIVLAAGGDKSFLVWQHLVQIFMNEWHMFVWPHILYVHKDQLNGDEIVDVDLQRRLNYFGDKFSLFVNALRGLKNELD